MASIRVGFGIDFHRLADDHDLVIGGVDIPYCKGLIGHSDADVLTHAICDALLGAATLGDIGTHFPDSDTRYHNISSLKLLKQVVSILADNNFHPVNIDSVVVAQTPKLSPYFPKMRQVLALILDLPEDKVSVKATTTEGLGAVGANKGISAQCVCLIERDPEYPDK